MKILIIDDEPPVRESIRLLIPWDRYGVQEVMEACSGMEAIEIMQREKPQIVFTDIRMPGMDGIEVLKWIREHDERMKVVIISGYNDFHYVRSALKFGSFDYILKPIDEEELTEVFEKALACWNREEQTRTKTQEIHMRANQYKPVLADNLFSRLIQDPDQYSAVSRTLQEEYSIGRETRQCRAAVITLDMLDFGLRRKFAFALDLLIFSITNICNELMQKDNTGLAFQNWNEKNEIVLLFFKRLPDMPQFVSQIQDALYTALRGRFYIGIGRTSPFPQGLPRAYSDARTALKQRNLLERFQYEHYYSDQQFLPHMVPLSDYADRLLLAVRRNDADSVRALLMEWARKAGELPSITVRQLELWWQEFVLLQSKWAKEIDTLPDPADPADRSDLPMLIEADLSFALPLNEWEELSLEVWVDKMAGMLSETGRLFERRQQANTIHEIKQYIRAHYCEDLNLQKLAEQFYLSPSHISRTFKQQFGENLTDFVSRLRIDRAKVLLADSELKISSIASSVGYQDEKYFSKAFKRFEGLSPKQFRKLHLK